VQVLCGQLPSGGGGASASSPHVTEWTLHALSRVAAALGPDFKPLVGATLSAVSSAALAPTVPPAVRTSVVTSRLCTALAAAIVPALAAAQGSAKAGQPQAMLYRCKVLVAASSRAHGAPHAGGYHAQTRGGAPDLLAAEELRLERTLLCLPAGAVPAVAATPPAALHSAIVHGLASPCAALRRASLEVIGDISSAAEERSQEGDQSDRTDPRSAAAGAYELGRGALGRVSAALLNLMDLEPEAESIDAAKRALLQLLHADGAAAPAFWLRALAETVSEGKRSEAGGAGDAAGGFGAGEEEDGEEGGGWDQNASGLPLGGDDEDEEEARKRQKEAQVGLDTIVAVPIPILYVEWQNRGLGGKP